VEDPKKHAVLGGITVLVYGLYVGLGFSTLLQWLAVGIVVGVFIDIDHLLLAMFVDGRWKEGLKWILHPWRVFNHADEFLEDLEYPELVHHRIITHLAVLIALFFALDAHPLVLPALLSLSTHIAADIIADQLP